MTFYYIFQLSTHTWLRLWEELVGFEKGGTMIKGLDYFKGHFEDFTLFSEMCVNLQKIQDSKITTQ